MSSFYDALELRSVQERHTQQFSELNKLIAGLADRSPYYAELLADFIGREEIDDTALARMPLTRKSDLLALQSESPPFGELIHLSPPELTRIFASPGPIYEPQTHRHDYWRFARALFAAGMRPGDLLHNCFSYHFTPAGAMVESGALALGCAVFPAGTGQSEMQVRTIADLKPGAYVGTPSFLKIILDKADEIGIRLASLRHGLVAGEYFSPELRKTFADRDIAVVQCYATADLGLIAYESPASGGMIVDEGIIVEIVRPGTGDPVPEGEVGEIVVTCLSQDYPLIRFATGDLSAFMPEASPCGRTNRRIRGWMGRADQSTKVRGLFVHPGQIAQVLSRHDAAIKARLVVTRSSGGLDEAQLQVEAQVNHGEDLSRVLAESFQDLTRLRAEVALCQPGALANDGKVIDDLRSLDD